MPTENLATVNKEDFAIVIGISLYEGQPPVPGVSAAGSFVEWLADPSGGGLPIENIKQARESGFVNRTDVDGVFEKVLQLGRDRENRHIARRLYVYLAGRGFRYRDDIALVMSDRSEVRSDDAVLAWDYASLFQRAVDEIVLIVNYVFDYEEQGSLGLGEVLRAPWVRDIRGPRLAVDFRAYAGERKWDPNSLRFTGVLLEGLHGAEAGEDGAITSTSLQDYVGHHFPRSEDAIPEFFFSGSTPIIFSQSGSSQFKLTQSSPPELQSHADEKAQSTQFENERVQTQRDDAAVVDELGRRPFAEVLAARIEEARNGQHLDGGSSSAAFMVHIHGPWGSGKTSILNFLRACLKSSANPWVVVTFNAWRQQRIRPPWWRLIQEIYGQSVKQLDFRTSLLLRARWLVWRIRADWLPALLTALLIAGAIFLVSGIIHFEPSHATISGSSTATSQANASGNQPTPSALAIGGPQVTSPESAHAGGTPASTPAASTAGTPSTTPSSAANAPQATSAKPPQVGNTPSNTAAASPAGTPSATAETSGHPGEGTEQGLKIALAIFAFGGAAFTFSRSLLFGSSRAAETYTELRSDPLSPIIRLFKRLVLGIRRPLVVLVDDLDRCDGKYVVELLEGIQTLFRDAPITYVVAADRKWICSSFETTYTDFVKTIGEHGRPLGYLFLDKVFQVSASVPILSSKVKKTYWNALLAGSRSADPKAIDEERKSQEKAAEQKLGNANTQQQLEAKIDEVKDNPIQEQAMRAAAAKRITSPEAQRETEHRLQPFADLLEPNPRSMKRLVNAYGLHQATLFLEGRRVPPEPLALWTIVTLRWPLLADFLTVHPDAASYVQRSKVPEDTPREVRKLFSDQQVRAVFIGEALDKAFQLDAVAIRDIVGYENRAGEVKTVPEDAAQHAE